MPHRYALYHLYDTNESSDSDDSEPQSPRNAIDTTMHDNLFEMCEWNM